MNIRISLYKIVKHIRMWYYRRMSTLKPIGNYKCIQPVLFLGGGKVRIQGVVFGYNPSQCLHSGYCHIEARHKDAEIIIGSRNQFNNNLSIVAEHGKIIIGDNCLFGANVSIINSDFHPISATKRHSGEQKSKDVVIGNNVWLGTNVSICKGVHIGDNAIVANGAVVFEDVKENTIVRGNPAVYYKTIHE